MGVIELAARSTIGDIESAPATFSSWSKCMQKAYCKWPVIIGIVIGSLIILSILFCLIRCLCCGLECCCGCFSCFNHCCPSPRRNKRSRYADGPSNYAPNSYHGYQPAPTMPPAYNGPQTAQFDTGGKKVHEDSLPAMPSWDNATTKRIEDRSPSEDVEMNSMHNQSRTGVGAVAAAAAGAGVGAGVGAGAGAGVGGRNRYGQNAGSPSPYGSNSPTHAYGGDMGAQRPGLNYDYSRPSLTGSNSYGSQHSSQYGVPQNPTSQARPQGGFRNPVSADQFQASAIAPTPSQYSAGYSTYSGSTRYEPSSHYGQETGVTQASPTSPRDGRPPSILQAGRKPVAGSWKDV